jgi:uncharacterized protein YggU (UPF0235/DUF167 family)
VAVAEPVLKWVSRRTQIDYFRTRSRIDLDCESDGGRIEVKVSSRSDRASVVGVPRGRESGGRMKKDPVTAVDKRNPFEGGSNKALSNEL